MPDASGRFRGISVPDLPWDRPSDRVVACADCHYPRYETAPCKCGKLVPPNRDNKSTLP